MPKSKTHFEQVPVEAIAKKKSPRQESNGHAQTEPAPEANEEGLEWERRSRAKAGVEAEDDVRAAFGGHLCERNVQRHQSCNGAAFPVMGRFLDGDRFRLLVEAVWRLCHFHAGFRRAHSGLERRRGTDQGLRAEEAIGKYFSIFLSRGRYYRQEKRSEDLEITLGEKAALRRKGGGLRKDGIRSFGARGDLPRCGAKAEACTASAKSRRI